MQGFLPVQVVPRSPAGSPRSSVIDPVDLSDCEALNTDLFREIIKLIIFYSSMFLLNNLKLEGCDAYEIDFSVA